MPADTKLSLLPAVSVVPGVTCYEIDTHQSTPFSASYFTVAPGFKTPLDQHIESECWIIVQGCGTLKYEKQIYCIKQNDIFYFATNKQHQVVNDGNETLVICSIYW